MRANNNTVLKNSAFAALQNISTSQPNTSQPISGQLPNITRVNSFIADKNKTLHTVIPSFGNTTKNNLPENLPATASQLSSSSEQPSQPARYIADGDGACMYRAYLAAVTCNPHWLSARLCPLKNIAAALESSGLAVQTRLAIAQATQLMLRELRAADTEQSPLAALGLSAPQLVGLVELFTQTASLEFADQLYRTTVNEHHFSLWDTHAVAQQLLVVAQNLGIAVDDSLLAVAEFLTNLIAQTIIERLNIPISHAQPVYLEAAGLHYNLRAPLGFFSQRSQAAPLETGLAPEVLAALHEALPCANSASNAGSAMPAEHATKSAAPLVKYHAKVRDGSELLRLLFAGISQDSSWLTSDCSAELLQDVVTLLGWNELIAQSTTAAFGSVFTVNALNELAELWLCSEQLPQLARLLIQLQNGNFSQALLQQATARQRFNFWDGKPIYKAIKQTLDAKQWQELGESFGANLPAFCHWLGERALENFTSALGVFINEDGQTHLRVDGDRFVLFASRDFFSNVSASADPQRLLLKNISPSNYELLSGALNTLTAASQDPFVQQLGQRWGAQSERHKESQAKPAAAKKAKKRAWKRGHAKKTQAGFKEPWREAKELFNTEYSEGYDEFKQKIAGFDLQEEANHNAERPLVGRQQAVEAFGSLLGDTLNFTSHKIAEKYNLNLNPKTNPGKDGFWAWMDNSTDWLARAFYQAANSFDTEKQTIELEIEAKSSEELQKLDQELAELVRKIAQKDGQNDADMQALVDKLAQAAKKVIDIHEPNLPPAERKRLVREIRKKNAQAGSRMEFIQQQNKYSPDSAPVFGFISTHNAS